MADRDVAAATPAAAGWMPLERTRIAGLPVDTADRPELVAAMLHDCLAARADPALPPRIVMDLNGQGVSEAATNRAYRDALLKADVIHSDGGIWVALSRYTGRTIKGRSCTTDMMEDFAAVAEREGLSFYILGGTEEANLAFVDYLGRRYPALRIAGRRNGYFKADEEDAVRADIDAAHADIVWVGMGKPREQVFANTLRSVRAGWVVTCGGCYNYFVGGYTRAPLWMRNNGLEWLHRMATEPRKFAWRYLTTNPHSLGLALWDLARLRLKRA